MPSTIKTPHIVIGGLILFFLLRFLGMIEFGFYDFTIFLMIISGFGFSIFFIGRTRPILLFISSLVFLLGIFQLILNSFVFTNESSVYFPVSLFTLGTGFLIIYIDNETKKGFAYAAAFFLFLSFVIFLLNRNFTPGDFFNSLFILLLDQWLVFILILLLLFTFLAKRK
ncbi:MAG: hypothetical protein AB9882_14850 [Ignavibacteriaceae bacterium]